MSRKSQSSSPTPAASPAASSAASSAASPAPLLATAHGAAAGPDLGVLQGQLRTLGALLAVGLGGYYAWPAGGLFHAGADLLGAAVRGAQIWGMVMVCWLAGLFVIGKILAAAPRELPQPASAGEEALEEPRAETAAAPVMKFGQGTAPT